MAKISTDDGRSINCVEGYEAIMGAITNASMNTYQGVAFKPILVTQKGMEFREDDDGAMYVEDWEKPCYVFIGHIVRILE